MPEPIERPNPNVAPADFNQAQREADAAKPEFQANRKAQEAAKAGDLDAAKKLLTDPKLASGIDPDVMQLLMALVAEQQSKLGAALGSEFAKAIALLREPSEEDKQKSEAQRKQQMRRAQMAKQIGDQVEATKLQEQSLCGHVKENGNHTFRGQVLSNNTVHIHCIRCHKPWDDLAATPEMLRSGLNLDMVKGLREEHLNRWKENSPAIVHYYQEQAQEAARINPTAPSPFGHV